MAGSMAGSRVSHGSVARAGIAGRLASCLAGLAVSVTFSAAAGAEGCPAPLRDARRLVLVTTPGMDATRARLHRFVRARSDAPWHPDGAPEPAVVGRGGLAWGDTFRGLARPGEPVKVEGDGRSPAGFFRVGRSFGFASERRPGHLVLRPGRAICVDDPASPAYNTIVTPRPGAPVPRGEDMGRQPLYRRGLVVAYPSDAGRRAGSCIFVHVRAASGGGTAGCVALPEARVAALQAFSADGSSVLAILPEPALARFPGCLPPALSRAR